MWWWLNGRLIPPEEARIDPTDRGFTLGDGLFETIAVRKSQPKRLDRHLARLAAGAEALRLDRPAELASAISTMIAANNLRDAVLRVTLSRGPSERGLALSLRPRPTLLISAAPWPPPSPPARAIIATVTRRDPASPLTRLKTLCCLDAVLARAEAAERKADEALLLNPAGRIAEAAAANVFAVIADALVTPPVAEGALPGTMRAAILDAGLAAERPLTPADLAQAEEAFLSSSLGLRPLIALEGRPIGNGAAGKRWRALSDLELD